MADRVSVTMTIGGAIRRSLIAALSDAIDRDGAAADWEGTPFDPERVSDGARIELAANEVAWGRFETIESFCQEAGLPFVRWAGGSPGSFGPERVVFDGIGEPQSYSVTDDDEVVLPRAAIASLGSMAAIERHFAAADYQPPVISMIDDVSSHAQPGGLDDLGP